VYDDDDVDPYSLIDGILETEDVTVIEPWWE